MLVHAQVLRGLLSQTRSCSPQLVTIHEQRLYLIDLRDYMATWGPSAGSPQFWKGQNVFEGVLKELLTLECFSQKQWLLVPFAWNFGHYLNLVPCLSRQT